MSGPNLASALRAAGRGWRVFPVRRKSKRPLVNAWQDQASTDEHQLRQWWSGPWEDANIGCVVPDGVVVLDVDPRHRGDETLERLEAEHGVLPTTLLQHTGSGGVHDWFHVDDPDALRQGADVLGPGVDTRCAGRGFVIIAPSVHPCGGTYFWGRGTKRVADAPDWLVGRLRKPPEVLALPEVHVPLNGSDRPSDRLYGRQALNAEVARLRGATIGNRNQRLYSAALRMGQLVAAGALDLAEVTSALAQTARDVGLDDNEISGTLNSGLGFGLAHPR
jgi:hypothetical protein